ncbi:MAG: hypothetical protein JWQ54_2043 [Mucilaginibacter sp.]|nr:hypothetical protein [Mucilaginibacter sp.]
MRRWQKTWELLRLIPDPGIIHVDEASFRHSRYGYKDPPGQISALFSFHIQNSKKPGFCQAPAII